MKVIIPCGGKSERFPNMRPPWMLTHPDGSLMVKKVIEGLNIEPKDVIITILKEYEEEYDVVRGLKENIGEEISVVVLEESMGNAPGDIYQTIKKINLNEPFLIRDSSDSFIFDSKQSGDYSYICYADIQESDEVDAGNKSYIKFNQQGIITDIAEKKVISRYFNVGGYFFKNPQSFIEAFEEISPNEREGKLYVSHIIQHLILKEKEIFLAKKVNNYLDWGTFKKWKKYTSGYKTYFFDVDGILFKNGAQYFKQRWEETPPILENVEVIRKLSENKKIQIFFVTARPEEYREMLEWKLKALGIRYNGLIMGCFHCNRIMVDDFSGTTGFPKCEAINILRNSIDLKKYIDTNAD